MQDGLQLIFPAIQGRVAGEGIALRVQLIFHSDGACHTAGVDVAGDGGPVVAGEQLTAGHGVDIRLRGIGEPVLRRGVFQVIHRVQHCVHDAVELAADGPDVVGQRVGGALHGAAELVHVAVEQMQRVVEGVGRGTDCLIRVGDLDGVRTGKKVQQVLGVGENILSVR